VRFAWSLSRKPSAKFRASESFGRGVLQPQDAGWALPTDTLQIVVGGAHPTEIHNLSALLRKPLLLGTRSAAERVPYREHEVYKPWNGLLAARPHPPREGFLSRAEKGMTKISEPRGIAHFLVATPYVPARCIRAAPWRQVETPWKARPAVRPPDSFTCRSSRRGSALAPSAQLLALR
jgi:hypothetical protein